MPEANAAYVGNDRLLFGIILGVLAFWLCAQTTLNIASMMATDLGIQMSVMNIAVSITALFSGIFIVVLGGLADRVGRVKVVQWGFVLSIVGSLLVALAPSGVLASAVLILGRVCQGLSAACIMPASLALVKADWEGAGRQRGRVRGLRTVSEHDRHGDDALEPAAHRGGGHPHRVDDAGADGRRDERAGGRAADDRVRDRNRRGHQDRREAVAALRSAQAD